MSAAGEDTFTYGVLYQRLAGQAAEIDSTEWPYSAGSREDATRPYPPPRRDRDR